MRRKLAHIVIALAAAIPLITGLLGGMPAQASTCTWVYGWAVYGHAAPPYSQTWIHSYSGCGSGYPIQFNQTGCGYIRGPAGEFYADGPTVHLGYSTVTCNAHPYGVVVDVYVWSNGGSGWNVAHVFHS